MENSQSLSDQLKGASIAAIARVIREHKIPVGYAAKPYYEAMFYIYSFRDIYGCDSASSIVAYFLANAGQMKGEVMRAVKKELNDQLKGYYKKNKV